MTSRSIVLGLVLALSVLSATSPNAAPEDRKTVQLRGRITDERGAPIPDATVTASGAAVLSTVANADGRYSLNLELGTVADLKLHPATWQIEARFKGKKIPLAGGAERLEFSVQGKANGAVSATASLVALGEQLDKDLAREGAVVAIVPLDFSRARAGGPARVDSTKSRERSVPGAPAAAPAAAAGAHAPTAAGARASAGTVAAPAPRKKGSESASELLESSKQYGSMQAADAAAASARSAERAAHREEERRRAAQEAARRDSVRRFERAQKQRAALARDSLRIAEQARSAREQATRTDSMRLAQHARDSVNAVARAESEARAAAVRDSQRALQKQREVLRMEELQRMLFKRDSSSAALRTRDSLNAANRARARAQDSVRAAARRDSLRAANPPPELDRRPVVGGKPLEPVVVTHVESAKPAASPGTTPAPCECRVRGTIEVRSEKPLASPLTVQIGVSGASAHPASVQLFMGSPRGFVFTHVPCGQIQLDVTIPAGRRFEVVDAATLGPVRCDSGGPWQPRLVLRPY